MESKHREAPRVSRTKVEKFHQHTKNFTHTYLSHLPHRITNLRVLPFAPVDGKPAQEVDFGLGSKFAVKLGLEVDAKEWDPTSATTAADAGNDADEGEGETKSGAKKKNKKKKKKKKVSDQSIVPRSEVFQDPSVALTLPFPSCSKHFRALGWHTVKTRLVLKIALCLDPGSEQEKGQGMSSRERCQSYSHAPYQFRKRETGDPTPQTSEV